jgi:hypothetical protein
MFIYFFKIRQVVKFGVKKGQMSCNLEWREYILSFHFCIFEKKRNRTGHGSKVCGRGSIYGIPNSAGKIRFLFRIIKPNNQQPSTALDGWPTMQPIYSSALHAPRDEAHAAPLRAPLVHRHVNKFDYL